ncbi:MAG: hypothetical protein MJY54_02175 [archaeon]|nr:hypothetical protein [archaeon]
MEKKCTVIVDAGVCKMKTTIQAIQQDDMMVGVKIESDCHNVLKMSWGIKSINPYTEIESQICKTDVYKRANDTLPHAACPVPCAIIKAVEVASGMGIKRDVTITIK